MKRRITAVILAALLSFGLAACGSDSPAPAAQPSASGEVSAEAEAAASETAPAPSGEERIVTVGMASSWGSPCVYFDTGNYTDIVWEQVYDRLWINDMTGQAIPRLASSYEISDDYLTWTIHLNENANFTDGVPVTAGDVVYTIRLLTDPDFKNLKGSTNLFAGTNDSGKTEGEFIAAEAIDDKTVQFNLKNPVTELKITNSFNRTFYVIPEHIFGQYTAEELNDGQIWKANNLGSGPFIYDTEIDGESVEYVANRNYFLQPADFDRLIIKVVAGSQLLSSLIAGEIDVNAGGGIASIPLSDWPMALQDENLGTLSQSDFGYQSLIYNLQSDKIGNDLIRRGLNMAINKQSIVDNLLEGEGQVLYLPYSDEHPYVDYSKLTFYDYDPEEAKRLLEEGGFDFGQTLELIVPTGNEVRIQSSVLIQQDFAAIGVKTNITQYDFSTLMQKMRDGEFDAGFCGSAGSLDPNFSGWLSNVSGTNFTCVPDDRYVSLFREYDSIMDFDEQLEKYTTLYQKILDESPISYLYADNDLIAYNKNKLGNLDSSRWTTINWTINEWDYIDD